MGRKRRLPARAREEAAAEEVARAVEAKRQDDVLRGKPDDALFVVDARGSSRKRLKLQKEAKAPKYLSKAEKNIIVRKYFGKGAKQAAAHASSKREYTRISDPWADDDIVRTGDTKAAQDVAKQLASTSCSKTGGKEADSDTTHATQCRESASADEYTLLPKKGGQLSKRPKPSRRDLAKLGVCHPGQSYNPTSDDHDDVLAAAVAVELRRQEAIDEERAPVSQGLSKETLEHLIGDEEQDSSDDEHEGKTAAYRGKPTPATGKLTRAQRNKQKRIKEAARALAERRKQKQMLKSVDQIVDYQKQLAEEERVREERRKTKRLLKAQKKQLHEGGSSGGLLGPSAGFAAPSVTRQSNKEIIASRSVPVNLGEELHGSLRQLRAQGSVLLDKVELLKASKAHPDRKHGKDRAKKAPKGFRKKHTYKDRYKIE